MKESMLEYKPQISGEEKQRASKVVQRIVNSKFCEAIEAQMVGAYRKSLQ